MLHIFTAWLGGEQGNREGRGSRSCSVPPLPLLVRLLQRGGAAISSLNLQNKCGSIRDREASNLVGSLCSLWHSPNIWLWSTSLKLSLFMLKTHIFFFARLVCNYFIRQNASNIITHTMQGGQSEFSNILQSNQYMKQLWGWLSHKWNEGSISLAKSVTGFLRPVCLPRDCQRLRYCVVNSNMYAFCPINVCRNKVTTTFYLHRKEKRFLANLLPETGRKRWILKEVKYGCSSKHMPPQDKQMVVDRGYYPETHRMWKLMGQVGCSLTFDRLEV